MEEGKGVHQGVRKGRKGRSTFETRDGREEEEGGGSTAGTRDGRGVGSTVERGMEERMEKERV